MNVKPGVSHDYESSNWLHDHLPGSGEQHRRWRRTRLQRRSTCPAEDAGCLQAKNSAGEGLIDHAIMNSIIVLMVVTSILGPALTGLFGRRLAEAETSETTSLPPNASSVGLGRPSSPMAPVEAVEGILFKARSEKNSVSEFFSGGVLTRMFPFHASTHSRRQPGLDKRP